MKNRRIFRLIVSIALGVVLAAGIAYMQSAATSPKNDTGVAGAPVGDNFDGLMDQQRRPATPERFAGTYQLVFFGFTHCPSICPTELQRLSLVLKNLTPAEKEKLSAIFVTVDPARDTPATLREYLSMFDPEIIGLTGTGIAVERVLANWKVYAAKVQTAEMSDYTMDHSAFLYFRGPDGRLIDLFDAGDTPDGITQTVRAHLGG